MQNQTNVAEPVQLPIQPQQQEPQQKRESQQPQQVQRQYYNWLNQGQSPTPLY